MEHKKVSLIKETKTILLYGSLGVFVLSWILFIIFLDIDIAASLVFGFIFSLIIVITSIISFYLLGIILFLKLALFFGRTSKNNTNSYIAIFVPFVLFVFPRLFDFNTFFLKMVQNTRSIILFSSLIILYVVCPVVNYFILKKIIKKYRINSVP